MLQFVSTLGKLEYLLTPAIAYMQRTNQALFIEIDRIAAVIAIISVS